MSVKEVSQALGGWGIALKPSTPRELLSEIERNKFGHIAVIPGRINPLQYGDGLLTKARYVGVYRATFKQSDDTVEIKGSGMAFWLGDEDDKGDIFETAVNITGATFPNAIRALLPPSGAVTEGTLYSVPGGGTYTRKHQWETPRKAITYVTDTYSAGDSLVEYRVNGNATLDAGPIANLYNMTPKAILVKKDTGRDMRLLGLQADMSMDYDVEDLTTRVVLLAQGEGTTISTGSANAAPTGFTDLHGNPIKQTRLVSESDTPAGNANTRAQLQLNRWALPRQAIQLRTQEFDIKGDFVVGDYIYVFDPEAGFFDLGNEVFWRGQPINPIALRIKEMDWNVRAGWTVAFRKNDGTWLDLSEYYKAEGGGSTLAVGDYRRTLAGNNYEPLGFRPNLPIPGTDTTIPGAPTFTGFSSGVYESDHRTLAAVRAQWAEPLNTDASTITDGDHYEIRYRTNAIIGTQVSWDDLAGGYGIDGSDDFNVNQAAGSWGPNWNIITGAGADFSVSGSEGLIAHPTFNLLRGATFIPATTYTDVEIIASRKISYVPLGASTVMGILLRRKSDGTEYYWVRVEPNTSLSVTLKVVKWKGGVNTELVSMVIPGLVHEAFADYFVKASLVGNAISVKVWTGVLENEPQRDLVNYVDSNSPITAAGQVGVLDYLVSGASNPAGSATRVGLFQVRSLTPDGVGSTYSWDDLGSWDAITSEPVTISPAWSTAYAGWDMSAYTIMELSPGVQYEFQIRAVDSSSPPNNGAWSASTFVNTLGDVIAPSTPAVPTVAASMIAVQVVHTLGKSSGGTFNLEQDLDHLEVHASDVQTYIPTDATKVGEMVATGAMVRAEIPAVGSFKVDQAESVWVRVVAVDRSGNKSAPSQAVQSSIVLIDNAHISDLTVSKVTAGTITAEWLMAGAIRTSQTGARVEMTSEGINAYRSDGTKTVEIKSVDGTATFTGKLQTELDDAGVSFETVGGSAIGKWSVNDGTGPLDHIVRQSAAVFAGLGGQGFETSIRRRSDTAQDGAKSLLSEDAHILSHQPASGQEAYLGLGRFPFDGLGPAGASGMIFFQGRFHMTQVGSAQGTLWCDNEVIAAGTSGMARLYGPTMAELMSPIGSITGSIGDTFVITSIGASGFTYSWNGSASHRAFIWAFRMDNA